MTRLIILERGEELTEAAWRALASQGRPVRLKPLVMCVVSLPTFAPSPLRDAWGLVENRPALLRVVAPSALLRAAVTPRA